MGRIKKDYTSAVLGLSLTGLGVIRSLGREGIDIFGFDYLKEKQDGFYSKYVKSILCPHPIYRPRELSDFLITEFKIPPTEAYRLQITAYPITDHQSPIT